MKEAVRGSTSKQLRAELRGDERQQEDHHRAAEKAKAANTVWFATDLDREGEAISWHLAEALSHDVDSAKRVVFNAITEREIREAFEKPRSIDMDRVNAQQARRILDRIVATKPPRCCGAITSGLSAGRVQSVAVRLVVEREQRFGPSSPTNTGKSKPTWFGCHIGSRLGRGVHLLQNETDADGKGPTKSGWPSGVRTTVRSPPNWWNWMVKRSSWAPLGIPRRSQRSHRQDLGFGRIESPKCTPKKIPRAKARPNSVEPSAVPSEPVFNTTSPASNTKPAQPLPVYHQHPANGRVKLPGLRTQGTMGIAQAVSKRHITYMRTDSPGCPPKRSRWPAPSSTKPTARPTFPTNPGTMPPRAMGPRSARSHSAHQRLVGRERPQSVSEEDRKVYDLIRRRFLASQMTDARWGLLNVRLVRADQSTGAVLRASGRTLEFDGYLKVSGVSVNADDQTLPELPEGTATYPFCVRPEQKFSSPPAATPRPRWSSDWKKKESDAPQPTPQSSRSFRIATTSNWLARASTRRTLGKQSPTQDGIFPTS